MRKIKILAAFLCCVMCMGLLSFTVTAAPADEEVSVASASSPKFNENEIAFTFATLSDPHIGFGNNEAILDNALKTLKSFSKNDIDALLFCGDQTQDGTEVQAKKFVEIVKNNFDITKIPLIAAHGNHDVYWQGCMTRPEFAEAYGSEVYTFDVDKESLKNGNRHVEINGYHFLTIDVQTYMPNYNDFSSETTTWFRNTIERIIANDPDAYIFVACHSPAKDTVFGSMTDDISGTGDWGASVELDRLLQKYPQVILFSGHTHYGINLETNINQSKYTQINAASSSDMELDIFKPENRRSYSSGMLVDVDKDNNIRITRIDLARNKQIRDCWYIDAYAEDGSHLQRYSGEVRRAENTPPRFPSTVNVTEISQNELRIDFKAAVDNDIVYYYELSVEDIDGKVIASKTVVNPIHDYPDLKGLPLSYSETLTGTFKYPYVVKVKAYDCLYEYTEFSQKMVDMSEQNAITAKNMDNAAQRLMDKELTVNDFETMVAFRKELNKLSYKVIALMNKYDAFVALEKEFYNKFFLTECSTDFAPTKADTFTVVPMSSKGWIDNTEKGITLNWNAGTKNYILGINEKYSLDGLHIGLSNLSLKSDNKVLGIIISNKAKDKWLDNESLLICIDFATGTISTGDGSSVGRSDYLAYNALGAIPFNLNFEILENGDLALKVDTPIGSDEFVIAKNKYENLPHLTNTEECYVSFSSWSTKTTMSIDVTAIHTEESKVECTEHVDANDDKLCDVCGAQMPETPPVETPSNPTDDPSDNPIENPAEEPSQAPSTDDDNEKSGCGSSIGLGTLALCAGVAIAGAEVMKKKKK